MDAAGHTILIVPFERIATEQRDTPNHSPLFRRVVPSGYSIFGEESRRIFFIILGHAYPPPLALEKGTGLPGRIRQISLTSRSTLYPACFRAERIYHIMSGKSGRLLAPFPHHGQGLPFSTSIPQVKQPAETEKKGNEHQPGRLGRQRQHLEKQDQRRHEKPV